MRDTDILVAGGGLAGSAATAVLARAGANVVLVDPHAVYPPDFRCEKLDGDQVRLLEKIGLAQSILPATTPDKDVWVARFGHVLEKRPSDQHGIVYHNLVNTVRAQIPPGTQFVRAKVTKIATSSDRQTVALSDGQEISARLVVLANGLNSGLRQALGMARRDLSPCHSITIGFDMEPVGRSSFDFRALTYYTEHVADRMAYLTLFPIGPKLRANLFVYRDMRDPWLRQLREAPLETLSALMPRLTKLTGDFAVTGFIKIRPADLYVTEGYRRPGIVLIGDAFATSCPAAGTGARKVLNDVERLCNVYIPNWLASDGMGEEKIAAFYDDPVKQACDAHSAAKAYYMRSLSIDTALPWKVRRWSRFFGRLGVGLLRESRERLSTRSPSAQAAAAGSGAGR
jgi:2-polyprenyl-6-methoxyphenol hydroxylase-like FAD-dependent oxidoreductase